MSVHNILNADGVINTQYLPAYVASDVRNPMIVDLDGGNKDITNVDAITCNNLTCSALNNLQWGEFPQQSTSSSITWAAKAAADSVDLYDSGAAIPAGTYLVNVWLNLSEEGMANKDNVITLQYSFGGITPLFTATQDDWTQSVNIPYNFTFLIYSSGSVPLQIQMASVGAHDECNIQLQTVGFLKLAGV